MRQCADSSHLLEDGRHLAGHLRGGKRGTGGDGGAVGPEPADVWLLTPAAWRRMMGLFLLMEEQIHV